MRTFIGVIDIIRKEGRSPFYNFKPLREIVDGVLIKVDYNELLPESQAENINLRYTFQSDEEYNYMSDNFANRELYVIDFEKNELEDNYNNDNERLNTGYLLKIDMLRKNNRIRPLYQTKNIIQVYSSKKVNKDSLSSNNIYIIDEYTGIREGQKIYIQLKEENNDFFAGPYTVQTQKNKSAIAPSSFYINTNIENNYILQGYRKNNAVEIIEDRYYTWSVAVLNDNDAIVHMDCLDNQGLIGYIRDIIPSVNDDINIDDAKKIIDIFNKFASKNSSIPDDIILSRSKRLQSIFNEFSSTKDFIDQFSDILVSYIAKNQESESVVKLMSGVVEKYPSIVSNSDIFKNLEDEVDRLLQENEDLKERKENVEVSSQKSNQVVSNKDENLISEINKNIEILNNQKIAIKKDIEDLQKRRKELETGIDDIEIKLINQTIAFKERIINHSVDTFVASKISMQETEWSNKKYVTDLTKNLDIINNSANYISIESDELINYIENAIKYERPDYSRNDILNLFICLTQSFFTVFSGKPGSGKTSICNIIAKSLGLNNIQLESSDGSKVTHSRYIPVSVERGWTSKRDFIGYYNPLSKTFNRTNKDMYDALITLDYEYRNNYLTLPYIVLLDEANLSPMEYYWADFMNICDNINDESIKNQINLGDNYVYNIPPTLRFLATINNDHTTEILSPRLIDRAFIVSLPESYSDIKPDVAKPDYKPVSWENLLDVFIPKEDKKISTKVLEIYKEIKELFLKENIYISPRIDKAVLLYCKTAASLFEEEYGISTDIIGLDYAVSQKLLPKISGNGESYKKWLSDELFNKLEKHNMLKSKFKVADILDSGERRMNYFQYFD